VQVVRNSNPPGAFNPTVNIPYIPYNYDQAAIDAGGPNPCGQLSVDARVTQGCPESVPKYSSYWCDPTNAPGGMNLGPNDFMCYGLIPMRNQDNQVEEDYTIATEPVDPVFYSTCFEIVPPGQSLSCSSASQQLLRMFCFSLLLPSLVLLRSGGFLNSVPYQYVPPSWDANDVCVDCDFHKKLYKLNNTQVPDWTNSISPVCKDCSIKNSLQSTAALPLAGANQPNAGPPAAVAYSWSAGSFSACSCSGISTRSVQCLSSSGAPASSSQCTAQQPASSQTCTPPSTCFVWQQSAWTACTASCGPSGTQTSTVQCVMSASASNPGTVVANSQCTDTMPATSRSCNTATACSYSWLPSGFGSCTQSCGSGTQTQTVSCVQTVNSQQVTVDNSNCVAGSKPATSRSCNTSPCADGVLIYSPWSACSASCGGGSQSRTQTCANPATGAAYPDNSRCSTATQAPLTQACNTQACPVYAWVAGTYSVCSVTCGTGSSTRSVACYDNANDASHVSPVSDSYCTASRPESSTQCNTQACPVVVTYAWKTGDWKACLSGNAVVTCGGATTNPPASSLRDVSCVSSTGAVVDVSMCASAGSAPANSQACGVQGCASFSWTSTGFSQCSVACGGGVQTQSSFCVITGTLSRAEGKCSGPAPATSQPCNTAACAPPTTPPPHQWVLGAPVTTCSAQCGTGYMTYAPKCFRTDVTPATVIDDSNCADQPQPPLKVACNTQSCPSYVWTASGFTACAKSCGGGTKTQTVYCAQQGTLAMVSSDKCAANGGAPKSGEWRHRTM
jgi:hypothetical protein